MLSHEVKETAEGRISIQNVDPEAFEHALKFMYTDQLEPDILGGFAKKLYRLADMYDMEKLLRLCEDHLLENIEIENVWMMYDLAESRPDSMLAQKSAEFISR